MKLAGRLAGPWLEELDRTWADVRRHADGVLLDLSEVTFVAPEGRERLESMYKQGACFKTSSCLGKSIVEQITTGTSTTT